MNDFKHAEPIVLIVLTVVAWVLYKSIKQARSSVDSIKIRRIPGIDAIDEAVGRAAETGRPISFCTGLTGIGPTLYACLGVLAAVAKKAALYKTKLLIPQTSPEAMALVDEVTRGAYAQAGRLSIYDPQNIVYLSDEQFAFASGYVGLVHREKVGSAFIFGHFTAESLILSDAGQQIGAMQVAATVDPEQAAFFICTCDYTLIGEELYAASAYLSKFPIQVGSIKAQDIVKFFFFILIIAGVICATLNSFSSFFDILNVEKILNLSWSDIL